MPLRLSVRFLYNPRPQLWDRPPQSGGCRKCTRPTRTPPPVAPSEPPDVRSGPRASSPLLTAVDPRRHRGACLRPSAKLVRRIAGDRPELGWESAAAVESASRGSPSHTGVLRIGIRQLSSGACPLSMGERAKLAPTGGISLPFARPIRLDYRRNAISRHSIACGHVPGFAVTRKGEFHKVARGDWPGYKRLGATICARHLRHIPRIRPVHVVSDCRRSAGLFHRELPGHRQGTNRLWHNGADIQSRGPPQHRRDRCRRSFALTRT